MEATGLPSSAGLPGIPNPAGPTGPLGALSRPESKGSGFVRAREAWAQSRVMNTPALLAAMTGQRPDHHPVWFMRQAGRSLPEYRAAREGTTMLQSCLTPDLAAEITLSLIHI